MAVITQSGAGLDRVFKAAFPSMTPLIGCNAVQDSLIRSLLQVQIESGIDTKAGFMNLFGAESLIEFLPHLFLEPRRNCALLFGNVKPQRGVARILRLNVRDNAI